MSVPTTACPRCDADVEDFDGFGVLFHDACGYCDHTSQTGIGGGRWRCEGCGLIQEDVL